MTRRPRTGPHPLPEPPVTDAAWEALATVCEHLAAGNFEERVLAECDDPLYARVRAAVNRLADLVDAFVREAQATLAAAGRGEFEREFLLTGMPGMFRRGAEQIDTGRRHLQAAQALEQQWRAEQTLLADAAFGASEVVAAAATELSASADVLASATHQAMQEAGDAGRIVEALGESSSGIEQAVGEIASIAAQTRLLALNATIEAARAGETGLGFRVVANEVKALADQAARAGAQIASQVQAVRESAQAAMEALASITNMVGAMDVQVDEIAQAAGGGPHGGEGLAQMAERLHTETGRIVHAADSSG